MIECKDLTKTYGKVKALSNVTYEIKENTITGLIGRNGAGKTTLLKTIAGFYHPSSGEIMVLKENPFNSMKVAANMIFIDDQMKFPPALNLSDILSSAKGFYVNWNEELANRLFQYFGFRPKQSHQKLSKGMKSTFNMIIGLSARCPLTIFDEPTTGMDAAVRKDFYRALLKDYIQYPRTIILSSHLLNEIEDLLENVLLINQGKIQLHMSVSDLREYAIGIRGNENLVENQLIDKEVLYKESIGKDSLYAVIKHDAGEFSVEKLKIKGIEVTSVSTNDLCVYLTSNEKGAIDDVFS